MNASGNTLLKKLILEGNSDFWSHLADHTRNVTEIDEILTLSTLRKKALVRKIPRPLPNQEKIRLAILGGYTPYPLHELITHFCEIENMPCELWIGDFDNYTAEIMDEGSGFHKFDPQIVLLIPSSHRCQYTGSLTDSRDAQKEEATRVVDSLLDLAGRTNKKSGAEVIIANFMLPSRHDLGAYRVRTLGSEWNFRKWVNLELGLNAPPYLQICDLEFLATRHGGINARDDRSWYESKQPCSSSLLPHFAREVQHLIAGLRRAPKKVLVLDLDNTLWGGVIADDGLEGIEVGDTSPRGEAFKAFQRYIATLKQRGVLLGVCSKNDLMKAKEPFEKHPEMVLRLEDFVSFMANWNPKSDNIRQMAAEMNLGLESFVFVDDNPAEIDIVRQFAPEVTALLLGPDPSAYVAQLQDSRLFEPRNLTREDTERTFQYRTETKRKELLTSVTDMDSYLESLGMEGEISKFTTLDVPRLSQLINKSNQFNLTTRRRSEAEVTSVMHDPEFIGYSVRLKDRFGDHGLISIVIGEKEGEVMKIDTWLMSCRVLKRQVEEETLNELARIAKMHQCSGLKGLYIPTAKNEMVRDFYLTMGFTLVKDCDTFREFILDLETYQPQKTKIIITKHAYE